MMVTFVSECEKKSLNKTRRVLDAFANRIGSRTWQTVITEEGLQAVKKLLRKTASKNTAVACHWMRSRSRSDLLWVVGNKDKFNQEGYVAVNLTEQSMDQYMDKNQWKTLEVIQYAAAIAGLFHDFGKANVLFQNKLNPKIKSKNYEPYRHEWISFRLFQAFVGNQTDQQWLEKLSNIDGNESFECFKDGLDTMDKPKLSKLPPFAQLVAWLVVTHHRLPLYPAWKKDENFKPDLKQIKPDFSPLWNSYNCKEREGLEDNWKFKELPIKSSQWRSKACTLASRVLQKICSNSSNNVNWLHEHLFTSHIARVCLMLADHFYSSLSQKEAKEKGCEEWRNCNYQVYANTEWVNNQKIYKQQLDEHLTGVAKHAFDIANALSGLNNSLTSLNPRDELVKNVGYNESDKEKKRLLKEKFGWQDKARKLVEDTGKDTLKNGFFGINMASTGKGKTRANAKIMTAIGQHAKQIRFSIALGLRVLTLQTGKEFRDELRLSDEEMAIAVGGIAVKQLFENQQQPQEKTLDNKDSAEMNGSASGEEMLDKDMFVHYAGTTREHNLSQWTKKQKGLDDLISAPVLVSTIDHLMPATEGTKGGKQIPAMLRLLTSDLVLDEPDDFGLSDLPALCRLVHWAGVLGCRVLLSTATIPPALAYALFQAYQAGWKQYAKANLEKETGEIYCAWFDEENRTSANCLEFKSFKEKHEKFVSKRIKFLGKLPAKRKAEIIKIKLGEGENIAENMANTIQENAIKLHHAHALSKNNKTLSVGLVRMANINPMVAVAKALLSKAVSEKDTCIHYCVYHSRYPLAIRSAIEVKLDNILNRKDPDAIVASNIFCDKTTFNLR